MTITVNSTWENEGQKVTVARQGKSVKLTVNADGPTITVEMSLSDWHKLTGREES